MVNGYAWVISAVYFGYINIIFIWSKHLKSYISTFRCYTHVKPKVVTKKDIKDIKGISSHTHTNTHTHTLYIYIYICTHYIYTHTYIYIYIYAYTYTGFNLMSCDSWFTTRFWIFTTKFFIIMCLRQDKKIKTN